MSIIVLRTRARTVIAIQMVNNHIRSLSFECCNIALVYGCVLC